ncbi:MAG TPA: hypothetical protein VIB00_18225 [Pyrinomonadaceae bacterium]|jgi:hypothetical protein
MTAAEVLRRLRVFLLILATLLFAGTLVELWLVNHTEDKIQWLAFVLCGLGLLVVLMVIFSRKRTAIRILRVCMGVVVLGSLLGIYLHVSSNFELEKEINPNSPAGEMFLKALGGANPLLAPGTLSVAALLALAATYRYSVVGDREES